MGINNRVDNEIMTDKPGGFGGPGKGYNDQDRTPLEGMHTIWALTLVRWE